MRAHSDSPTAQHTPVAPRGLRGRITGRVVLLWESHKLPLSLDVYIAGVTQTPGWGNAGRGGACPPGTLGKKMKPTPLTPDGWRMKRREDSGQALPPCSGRVACGWVACSGGEQGMGQGCRSRASSQMGNRPSSAVLNRLRTVKALPTSCGSTLRKLRHGRAPVKRRYLPLFPNPSSAIAYIGVRPDVGRRPDKGAVPRSLSLRPHAVTMPPEVGPTDLFVEEGLRESIPGTPLPVSTTPATFHNAGAAGGDPTGSHPPDHFRATLKMSGDDPNDVSCRRGSSRSQFPQQAAREKKTLEDDIRRNKIRIPVQTSPMENWRMSPEGKTGAPPAWPARSEAQNVRRLMEKLEASGRPEGLFWVSFQTTFGLPGAVFSRRRLALRWPFLAQADRSAVQSPAIAAAFAASENLPRKGCSTARPESGKRRLEKNQPGLAQRRRARDRTSPVMETRFAERRSKEKSGAFLRQGARPAIFPADSLLALRAPEKPVIPRNVIRYGRTEHSNIRLNNTARGAGSDVQPLLLLPAKARTAATKCEAPHPPPALLSGKAFDRARPPCVVVSDALGHMMPRPRRPGSQVAGPPAREIAVSGVCPRLLRPALRARHRLVGVLGVPQSAWCGGGETQRSESSRAVCAMRELGSWDGDPPAVAKAPIVFLPGIR
eukprot:gene13168-biopygen12492